MKKIEVKTATGTIIAEESGDTQYPGICLYFQPDDDDGDETLLEARIEEVNHKDIRMLIWGDENSEDYSEEIKWKQSKQQKNF